MYRTNLKNGVPRGVRTPVTAVKGRCPRPLDDGDQDSEITNYERIIIIPGIMNLF